MDQTESSGYFSVVVVTGLTSLQRTDDVCFIGIRRVKRDDKGAPCSSGRRPLTVGVILYKEVLTSLVTPHLTSVHCDWLQPRHTGSCTVK